MHKFDDITLLITHYNRSTSLERLLKNSVIWNVVSEISWCRTTVASREHIDYINSLKSKYTFNLVTTPKNKGLGNNINKGQDAVKTHIPYMFRKDFVPQAIFPKTWSTRSAS